MGIQLLIISFFTSFVKHPLYPPNLCFVFVYLFCYCLHVLFTLCLLSCPGVYFYFIHLLTLSFIVYFHILVKTNTHLNSSFTTFYILVSINTYLNSSFTSIYIFVQINIYLYSPFTSFYKSPLPPQPPSLPNSCQHNIEAEFVSILIHKSVYLLDVNKSDVPPSNLGLLCQCLSRRRRRRERVRVMQVEMKKREGDEGKQERRRK